jgi:hypothetical protein
LTRHCATRRIRSILRVAVCSCSEEAHIPTGHNGLGHTSLNCYLRCISTLCQLQGDG